MAKATPKKKPVASKITSKAAPKKPSKPAAKTASKVAAKSSAKKSGSKAAGKAAGKKTTAAKQTGKASAGRNAKQVVAHTPARAAAKRAASPQSEALLQLVLHGIREKKGTDIAILNLRGIPNMVTDYFVICSGSSDRQTVAIADSIEDEVKKQTNEKPWQTEGRTRGEWILLDYVNVVVHVMLPQQREFYNLEELWGDAQIERHAQ
jgi:ribosome-associated protein